MNMALSVRLCFQSIHGAQIDTSAPFLKTIFQQLNDKGILSFEDCYSRLLLVAFDILKFISASTFNLLKCYRCAMSRLIYSQSRADDLGLLDVMLFY